VTGPVKETLGDLQSVEVRNFGNNSSLWSNSIILKKILSFFLCARGVGGGKRRVRSQRKNDLFSSSSSHSVLLASVWDRFVKESGREGAETPKGLTFFPSELFFLPRQLFFFATFFQFSRAGQKRILISGIIHYARACANEKTTFFAFFKQNTGIKETLYSRVEVCTGRGHVRGWAWFVPDYGRVHGGVRVGRDGRAVGARSWTALVFHGGSSSRRRYQRRRGSWDWRGYSIVRALGGHSLRCGGGVAILRRRRCVGVGNQRVRLSLRAIGNYFKQLQGSFEENSVRTFELGEENRIGWARFAHGDVAVVAESDGV